MESNIKKDAVIKLKSIIMTKERELDGVFEELDGVVDISIINGIRESRERHLNVWKYILNCVASTDIK